MQKVGQGSASAAAKKKSPAGGRGYRKERTGLGGRGECDPPALFGTTYDAKYGSKRAKEKRTFSLSVGRGSQRSENRGLTGICCEGRRFSHRRVPQGLVYLCIPGRGEALAACLLSPSLFCFSRYSGTVHTAGSSFGGGFGIKLTSVPSSTEWSRENPVCRSRGRSGGGWRRPPSGENRNSAAGSD